MLQERFVKLKSPESGFSYATIQYLSLIYIFKKPNIDIYTDEIKCRRCRNSLNICRFRHWSIVSISRPTMDYSAVIDYYINVHQAAWTHTWVVRNQFFKLSGCFYRGCIYEVREVKAFSRKYARNERSLIKFQRLSRLFYRDNYPDVYVYIYVYVCLSSSCHNPAQFLVHVPPYHVKNPRTSEWLGHATARSSDFILRWSLILKITYSLSGNFA